MWYTCVIGRWGGFWDQGDECGLEEWWGREEVRNSSTVFGIVFISFEHGGVKRLRILTNEI